MGQGGVRIDGLPIGGPRVWRLGLVGVGAWGRRYVDTIGRRSDARIAAFARGSARTDGDPAGAVRHAGWTDLVELGARGDLDGLIVATTPLLQAEIAEAAVARGVPLLLEKPVGLSAEAARRVLACFRAAAAPAPVLVDYVHLWAPAYRALRGRLADAGGAAEVAFIATEGSNRGPFRGWSSLFDYGCHDVALCVDLLGTGAAFQLHDARRVVSPDVPAGELYQATFTLGATTIRLRTGNGAAEKTRRFAVTTRAGARFVYDDLQPHPHKLLEDGAPIAIDRGAPLDAVVADFIARLDGSPPGAARPTREAAEASLALSLRIAEILDAIAAAAA